MYGRRGTCSGAYAVQVSHDVDVWCCPPRYGRQAGHEEQHVASTDELFLTGHKLTDDTFLFSMLAFYCLSICHAIFQCPRNGQKGPQDVNLVLPMTIGGLSTAEVMLGFAWNNEKAFSWRILVSGYRRTQGLNKHVPNSVTALPCEFGCQLCKRMVIK